METEQLIGQLVTQAAPVHRWSPPLVRALVWLGCVLLAGGILLGLTADVARTFAWLGDGMRAVQAAGALATGILSIVAAFHLSVPGRSGAWALLPMPALAVWLSASGLGCWQHLASGAGGDWDAMKSTACLRFIVGFGVPLSVGLLWAVRPALRVVPTRALIVGALGAAALAACLLQFFHRFDVTFLDLSIHAIAVLLVVALCAAFGRRALA